MPATREVDLLRPRPGRDTSGRHHESSAPLDGTVVVPVALRYLRGEPVTDIRLDAAKALTLAEDLIAAARVATAARIDRPVELVALADALDAGDDGNAIVEAAELLRRLATA